MSSAQQKGNSHGVVTGYVIVGGAAVLTLLHLGVLGLVLAVISIFFTAAQIKNSDSDIHITHLRWQRRTASILLLSMLALLGWIGYEAVVTMTSSAAGFEEIFAVLAVHWLAHTIVSVVTALWMMLRVIKGLLRHTDYKPMYAIR
ncbi:MAG: hypothetical protein ABFS08_02975 [Pseudomonadota bacterium]